VHLDRCGDLPIGKAGNVSACTGMFEGHADQIAVFIQINQSIFVKVPSFADLVYIENQVERIGILEILDLHKRIS